MVTVPKSLNLGFSYSSLDFKERLHLQLHGKGSTTCEDLQKMCLPCVVSVAEAGCGFPWEQEGQGAAHTLCPVLPVGCQPSADATPKWPCVCASAPLSLPPSSLQQHPALNAEGWGLASLCALLVVSCYAPISNMYSDVSQEYQDALFLQKINGVQLLSAFT